MTGTDLQVLTAMLDRAGIPHHDGVGETLGSTKVVVGECPYVDPPLKNGPNGGGYRDFFTDFDFDARGALSAVRAWE